MWIRYVVISIIGLAGGVAVAGGFLALITLLGVIPRLAGETKSMKKAILYENFLILGALLGNLVSLYSIPMRIGGITLAIFGLFSGIFVGCLAVALAEIINTFPIFARRLSLRKGAPYIVLALALGKGAGSFFQYFIR